MRRALCMYWWTVTRAPTTTYTSAIPQPEKYQHPATPGGGRLLGPSEDSPPISETSPAPPSTAATPAKSIAAAPSVGVTKNAGGNTSAATDTRTLEASFLPFPYRQAEQAWRQDQELHLVRRRNPLFHQHRDRMTCLSGGWRHRPV